MEDNTQNFKELQPGTGLNGGKYVIEKKIGEGGFGITYKAVQQGLNRSVCIKEYFLAGYCVRNTSAHTLQLQGIAPDTYEKYRQAFVREAQTLASLHHTNIVEIIDVFDENNTSYMVMPFIEGRSLQSIVENNGPLSYPDAVNYITQVANAVGYIHERHILHRDIKPDNIMITADYKAILIDFGSAREFEEDKTQAHTSMLTHGYAPTEQYTRNSRKGSYTDIYALGATLYFILTGKVPIEAAARIVEPMPEPIELNPSLPIEANSTIMKAMQLKPADRYQNVNTFLNDLLNKNSDQTQPTVKTPPPLPKRETPTPTPVVDKQPTPPPIKNTGNNIATSEGDDKNKSRKTMAVHHFLVFGLAVAFFPFLNFLNSIAFLEFDSYSFLFLVPLLSIILPSLILFGAKKTKLPLWLGISLIVANGIVMLSAPYFFFLIIMLVLYYMLIVLIKIGKKHFTYIIAFATILTLCIFASYFGYTSLEIIKIIIALLLLTAYEIIQNNGKKWQLIVTASIFLIVLILYFYFYSERSFYVSYEYYPSMITSFLINTFIILLGVAANIIVFAKKQKKNRLQLESENKDLPEEQQKHPSKKWKGWVIAYGIITLITAIIGISAILSSTTLSDEDEIRETAMNFLYEIDNMDYADAKDYATPASAEALDAMESLAGIAGETDKGNGSFTIDYVNIYGETADVHYTRSEFDKDDESSTLEMEKIDGRWLVKYQKESSDDSSLEE